MRNSEGRLSRRSVLAGVGAAIAGGIVTTQPASAATTTDPPGTYATASRTGASAVGQGELVVNVMDYGADPTFTSDSTSAFASALGALTAGGTLWVPAGKYKLSGQIAVSKSITIAGAAMGDDDNNVGSVLVVGVAFTGYLFNVTAANSVTFRDLNITNYDSYANTSANHCTAIAFTTGRGHAVQRCRISNFYNNIDFQNCDFWVVSDSQVVKAVNYCLRIANAALPDSGDSFCNNNWIGATTSGSWMSAALIRQESGGGAKFSNNKILGGAIGYQLAVPDGVATSVALFSNNSFEGQTTSCVDLIQTGTGTGGFSRVSFLGNEFLGNRCTAHVFNAHFTVAGLLQQLTIVGNTFSGAGSGVSSIRLDYVSEFTVNDNYINGGAVGLLIGANCRGWHYRGNHISGVSSSFIKNAAYYQFAWSDNTSGEIERARYVFNNSTSIPTAAAVVGLPNPGALVLEVIVSGQLYGAGNLGIGGYYQRLLVQSRAGSRPAIATIGTDTTTGAPFTLTITPGVNNVTVWIGRSASDGGASGLNATVIVRAKGTPYSV